MKFLDKYSENEKRLVITGMISLIILIAIIFVQQFKKREPEKLHQLAIEYMDEMISEVSKYCEETEISIDFISDPQRTGLIGPEWTEMTTTIGHLDAKRTTINSDFAALMLKLFEEAGLKENDTIAIGCSGSFPGLLLASHSAAKAKGIVCQTILSLGASSYGANRTNLSILKIYNILLDKGLIETPPVAVSLGGENDRGEDWENLILTELSSEIQKSGYLFINASNLQESVSIREELYDFDQKNRIKAFVNAGGAMANIGTSHSILDLKPGIVKKFKIPEPSKQGVLHRALINEIPVIHLLNIKGLAIEYGLPWDPVIR